MHDSDNAWVSVAAAPVLLMTLGLAVVVKDEQANNAMIRFEMGFSQESLVPARSLSPVRKKSYVFE